MVDREGRYWSASVPSFERIIAALLKRGIDPAGVLHPDQRREILLATDYSNATLGIVLYDYRHGRRPEHAEEVGAEPEPDQWKREVEWACEKLDPLRNEGETHAACLERLIHNHTGLLKSIRAWCEAEDAECDLEDKLFALKTSSPKPAARIKALGARLAEAHDITFDLRSDVMILGLEQEAGAVSVFSE